MNIKEAKKHIGAEVVLLEHTKPYMLNGQESIANYSKTKPSKLFIDKTYSNNTVAIVSPEDHRWIIDPRHIKLKVIENLDVEVIVTGTPSSNNSSLKFTFDTKKPVHEWNVDDAFYANNHGEEVEVFCGNEWFLLDEMNVANARGRSQFRIKPKQVFLNAGTYYEEDLVKIINDNFKK